METAILNLKETSFLCRDFFFFPFTYFFFKAREKNSLKLRKCQSCMLLINSKLLKLQNIFFFAIYNILRKRYKLRYVVFRFVVYDHGNPT